MAQPVDLFSNAQEHVLLNPRLAQEKQGLVQKAVKEQTQIKNHFWLMSSGTESARLGQQKMIALSREAILTAAEGVVHTFMLDSSDVGLQSLPPFHIGGLSLYARAYVSGLKVVEAPQNHSWSAEMFTKLLREHQITIASLVPTQIYDLVQRGERAPECLRWVFVGGGSLAPALLVQARELGWPLILTYGMTETCAMLAHSADMREGAQRFPHIKEWRAESDGRLSFLTPALLTSYLFVSESGGYELYDPKVKGWYRSDDCGEIQNELLFLKGRQSELVKINGETVSLLEVQNEWDSYVQSLQKLNVNAVVVAIPHERKGHELVLASSVSMDPLWLEKFNQKVLPFQRLERLVQVPEIPATALGKILRGALSEKVQQIIQKTSQHQ